VTGRFIILFGNGSSVIIRGGGERKWQGEAVKEEEEVENTHGMYIKLAS